MKKYLRASILLLITAYAMPVYGMEADLNKQLFEVIEKKGDKSEIERLLLKDVRVNMKDHHGRTALHFAARVNNPQATKSLLGHGANPFIENNQKRSPLTMAYSMEATLSYLNKTIPLLKEAEENWRTDNQRLATTILCLQAKWANIPTDMLKEIEQIVRKTSHTIEEVEQTTN